MFELLNWSMNVAAATVVTLSPLPLPLSEEAIEQIYITALSPIVDEKTLRDNIDSTNKSIENFYKE